MDKRTFILVLALTVVLFGVNVFFEQQNQEKLKEWNAKQEIKKSQKTPLQESQVKPFVRMAPDSAHKSENEDEKFYVIENNYQQLVFSNKGGALREINLPFKTEKNQQSVVLETEFDREMVKDHPENAQFPLRAFLTPGTDPKTGFKENTKGQLGGYYPLLRRDYIQTAKHNEIRIPAQYYAANIVSEYPEVAELIYNVKEFTDTHIVFEANQPHRRITKTYSVESELTDAPYCINLTIQIEGDSRGLWVVTGVPEVEWISGAIAPALKYRITRNDKSEVILLDLPKDNIALSSIYPDWICNSNGFFGIILDPLTTIDAGLRAQYIPGKTVPSRLFKMDDNYDKFKLEDLPGYTMQLPLNSNGGTMGFRLFTGPFADGILKAVDKVYSNDEIGYNPDYIAAQTFHGWFAFISAPFAKFLFVLMNFFHFITGSWGFSIILLTVALRIMLYPLNAWSTKSMIKMQQIAPDVTAIQEKYKKDPKKAQLEVMNLYREKGVNPVSGCLPLLIQMPFLIGMFDLLKSTFELRGASFIPGWIDDLSAPDVLFSWTKPIFFIGNQFHLLPILLGAVMLLQQRMSSTAPKDVNLMTEQQRQQKTMGTIMAVVFAVMFYNFPSGLNIYWLSSMLLGILQQWWTSKRLASAKLPIKAK
jgi:YidC/Oxa1 family membrane protein insertase